MKHTVLFSSLLTLTLVASPFVLAENNTENSMENSPAKTAKKSTATTSATADKSKKTTDKAVKEVEKKQNAALEIIHEGVLEGFNKVEEATALLKNGKEKEAIKALELATGKFDVALTAEPALGLVPMSTKVVVSELLSSPAGIKSNIELAISLLKEHNVQTARLLLQPMRDDIVTSTTYLPMATYPDAIKLATKHLIEGKKEEAVDLLATTLSTFVTKESIIPLGLVRAEALLAEASTMNKETDKDKISVNLILAEEQLEIATLLGYTSDKSAAYEDIKAQIKILKKEIKGENVIEKMYDKLKTSFSTLIGKETTLEETAKPITEKPDTTTPAK